jgi:hypothetical protein
MPRVGRAAPAPVFRGRVKEPRGEPPFGMHHVRQEAGPLSERQGARVRFIASRVCGWRAGCVRCGEVRGSGDNWRTMARGVCQASSFEDRRDGLVWRTVPYELLDEPGGARCVGCGLFAVARRTDKAASARRPARRLMADGMGDLEARPWSRRDGPVGFAGNDGPLGFPSGIIR